MKRLLCCLAMLLPSISTLADVAVFRDDNLAIVDVSYKRQIIGGLDIYLSKSTYYIPLVDYVSILEFDIDVDAGGATGFFDANKQRFSLSYNESERVWNVEISGEKNVKDTIIDDSILVYEDILYVEQGLLSLWFETSLNLRFSESTIDLDVGVSSPAINRIYRKNRKIGVSDYIGDASEPILVTPYKWAEIPSADVRLSYLSTRNEDKRIKNYQSLNYSARTVGDFLAMSTETFVTGSRDEGIRGASIRMERYDEGRGMLGPLRLSQIGLGDISAPVVGEAPSTFGRGLIIGNDILHGGRSRDLRTIEGDYHPGWEVEIYLGSTLIGYQVIDETGHYKFDDVTLFEGANRFTLKFYGENGQEEEETRQIIVGDDPENLAPFRYSAAISQPGKKVISVGDDETGAEDDYQASLSGRLALGKNFSLNAGVQKSKITYDYGSDSTLSLEADNDSLLDNQDDSNTQQELDELSAPRTYYNIGANLYLGGLSLSLNTTLDDVDRKSYRFNASGIVVSTQVSATVTRFEYGNEFEGAGNSPFATNRSYDQYSLALSRQARFGGVILDYDSRQNGIADSETLNLGFSLRQGWFGWNNAINYQSAEYFENDELLEAENIVGTTLLSASSRKVNVRVSGVYTIEPDYEFTNVNFSSAFRLDNTKNLDLSASHNLTSDNTIYKMGLAWVNDDFRVLPSVSYDDKGRWKGSVQLSLSLGKRNGRLGSYYRAGSNPALTRGAIRARLFEDVNDDGLYQVGEPLLSGGEIEAIQLNRKARSNKAGVAWMELLPSWRRSDIAINENSINEGYMSLAIDDFSVVTRPGNTINMDLPFLRVGEIDGVVEILDGDDVYPGIGLVVKLVNSKNLVVSEKRADSTAYFSFERVVPGVYSIVVEGYEPIAKDAAMVNVGTSGDYLGGLVIQVREKTADNDKKSLLDEYDNSKQHYNSIDSQSNGFSDASGFSGIERSSVTQSIEVSEAVEPLFDIPTVSNPNVTAPTLVKDSIHVQGEELVEPVKTQLWVVQTVSYSNLESAKSLVEKIQQQGFGAQYKAVDLESGRYYRVFASGFLDEGSAKAAKSSLDEAFNVKSIVKRM